LGEFQGRGRWYIRLGRESWEAGGGGFHQGKEEDEAEKEGKESWRWKKAANQALALSIYVLFNITNEKEMKERRKSGGHDRQ